MRYRELVSYTREIRPLKTDLLVIVSSFSGYGFVIKHLSSLARQTYQKFNVLLVLGLPFDDARLERLLRRKRYRFGVIIAKENERRGCSGAFFTGQKYALEQGYPYVIMADDDCMPVDRRLVEELYRNRGRLYVAATMRFVEDGYRKKGIVGAPTSYSLIAAEVFRKYGLYYLPLFHGADDGEFMERVKIRPFNIRNSVEHPYIVGMRLFSMFDRAWFFLLQGIIIVRDVRATLYNLALFAFMCCAGFCFLPQYGRRLAIGMNRLLFSYTYGRKASDALRSGYQQWIEEKKAPGFRDFAAIRESDPSSIDEPVKKKFLGMMGQAIRLFRRDVVIEKTYSFALAFFLAITARRLYVRVEHGRYLLFADNRNAALHAARLLLFGALLPLQALAALLFLPLKAALQPHTLGYGLD